MWLFWLLACATKAPLSPASPTDLPPAAPTLPPEPLPRVGTVNALHSDWVDRHPGAQVSVCRRDGTDGVTIRRVVRTPTGEATWVGDGPGRLATVDSTWSLVYDNRFTDRRWRLFDAAEDPPRLSPVEGTREPLPELPEMTEGCITTALPEAPVWLRQVTTPDGPEETLGRPPRFPSDHGLGEPIRTAVRPGLLEFWIAPLDPDVLRTLGRHESYRFLGPRYPFPRPPFPADWGDLEEAYSALGAPEVRALGRAVIDGHGLYFLRPDDPDAAWTALGPYQDRALPCDFDRKRFVSWRCQEWRFARHGDWLIAQPGPDPIQPLPPGDEPWWASPTDKATFHRADIADPPSRFAYHSVRIHEDDGWWVVTAQ